MSVVSKRQYPYIGENRIVGSSQLVLFTSYRTGININGIGWGMGHYSENWDEYSFEEYTGEVTLNLTDGQLNDKHFKNRK